MYNLPIESVKRSPKAWGTWNRIVWAGAVVGLLAACGTPTPSPEATSVLPVTSTLSPIPPTLTITPEPLAARVNGEPIALAAYEKEEMRCRAGRNEAGLDPADCPALALQSLIEQKVVEQAAAAAGIAVSEGEVEAALTRITSDLGGPDAYQAWLAANLYSDDEFREALRRERVRARMAEQIAAHAQAGETAEQVHAQALLVADEATAQALLEQIRNNADFAQLALAYSLDLSSRAAGGDLGWFPRGGLTVPEVEAAAFALQPGETSGVIRSALGYHIVQVIERDPSRPLSPGAAQALRARAYRAWLDELLAKSVVEKFIAP